MRITKVTKKKGLSQEEVADILHVTRQTISKWETDQSMPDFDKVIPICNLYEISTEELFKEEKSSTNEKIELMVEEESYPIEHAHKKALFTTIAVMLYILSVVVIIFFSVVLRNPILGVCVFFIVIAIATGLLVYMELMNPEKEGMVKENEFYRKRRSYISKLLVYFLYLFSYLSYC